MQMKSGGPYGFSEKMLGSGSIDQLYHKLTCTGLVESKKKDGSGD